MIFEVNLVSNLFGVDRMNSIYLQILQPLLVYCSQGYATVKYFRKKLTLRYKGTEERIR